jgi:hypothetical protein
MTLAVNQILYSEKNMMEMIISTNQKHRISGKKTENIAKYPDQFILTLKQLKLKRVGRDNPALALLEKLIEKRRLNAVAQVNVKALTARAGHSRGHRRAIVMTLIPEISDRLAVAV